LQLPGRAVGVIAAIFALACSVDDPVDERAVETNTDAPLIYSVNYPLAYFAQRVGGEDVRVVFPAPPNTPRGVSRSSEYRPRRVGSSA